MPVRRSSRERGCPDRCETLLGMGTIDHDRLGERGGGRPDLLGERRDARRCPGRVAPMRARHVIGHGDVAALAERLGVAGDALALVESLDGAFGDAHIDEFADQSMRNRIPAPVDLDMIVGGHPAALPGGERVGLLRQRLESRDSHRGEKLGATGAVAAHHAGIEVADQLGDGRFSSDRLKKRAFRRRPRTQRSTNSTDCSTLALSRGL